MMQLKNLFWLIGFAGLLLGSGCSNDAEQAKTNGKTVSEARYLSIKGSDTMVHLVSSWAEKFMAEHPEADLSVTGGGTGTGIAALLNGTTDVCAASRRIKPQEMALAAKQGFTPVEYSVALDGIAVVVNPANPVSELTLEELRKIFTGAVSNWQQVGGPDQPILVMSRESSSGTFVFFQEMVLDKRDYTDKALFMQGTSAIINNIANDKWSIGYVGLGYTMGAKDKVKVVDVAAKAGSTAVSPSDTTVKDGSYPIARPLFLYTAGAAAGATRDFIDFALGSNGQEIVRATGYVTVK